MTEHDVQGAKQDGIVVMQLNTASLRGARDALDQRDRMDGGGPTFTLFAVAPHLFPEGWKLDWAYSLVVIAIQR